MFWVKFFFVSDLAEIHTTDTLSSIQNNVQV